MGKLKTEPIIDSRTLDRLLSELKDVHGRLGDELGKLTDTSRMSDAYRDRLAEIYTQLTWLECLARDLKAEMDLIDDQLPDD
jgi:hypothetical protein